MSSDPGGDGSWALTFKAPTFIEDNDEDGQDAPYDYGEDSHYANENHRIDLDEIAYRSPPAIPQSLARVGGADDDDDDDHVVFRPAAEPPTPTHQAQLDPEEDYAHVPKRPASIKLGPAPAAPVAPSAPSNRAPPSGSSTLDARSSLPSRTPTQISSANRPLVAPVPAAAPFPPNESVSCANEITFKGIRYWLQVRGQGSDRVIVAATDLTTGETFASVFTAQYIQTVTAKVGCFKRYQTFVKMLVAVLSKDTDTLKLQLLTFQDLQAMQTHKTSSAQPSKGDKSKQALHPDIDKNKRYLIIYYETEWDRVRYPLPLESKGRRDPKTIRLIPATQRIARSENDTPFLKHRRTAQMTPKIQERIADVDNSNSFLFAPEPIINALNKFDVFIENIKTRRLSSGAVRGPLLLAAEQLKTVLMDALDYANSVRPDSQMSQDGGTARRALLHQIEDSAVALITAVSAQQVIDQSTLADDELAQVNTVLLATLKATESASLVLKALIPRVGRLLARINEVLSPLDGESDMLYSRAQLLLKKGPHIAAAVKLLMPLAEQGHAPSQVLLGRCYEDGHGVKADINEAARLYYNAAAAGFCDGQVAYGECLERGLGVDKNEAEACRLYWLAAEQGDPNGQVALGKCYQRGRGTEKNLREAAKLFGAAAQQNNPRALFLLGFMYAEGVGVPKDEMEAVRLYKRSADLGYSQAQTNLGICFQGGLCGLKQNLEEAGKLYKRAAEQGNLRALCNLGGFYAQGLGGFQRNQQLALKFWEESAKLGHVAAMYNLGECWEHGRGVTVDLKRAVYWYRKGAEGGNTKAREAIARLQAIYQRNVALQSGHAPPNSKTVNKQKIYETPA